MVHSIPGATCPECGATLDAAERPNGDDLSPKVGDVTTCLYCSSVLQFSIGLALVLAPDHALVDIAGDPNFKAANATAAMFASRHKNNLLGKFLKEETR